MANQLLQKIAFDTQLFKKDIESDKNSSFCNGPFWDLSLTWDTDDPDLPQCFRDTILVGVPCAFLWCIGLPIWLWNTIVNNPRTHTNDKQKDQSNRSRLKGMNFSSCLYLASINNVLLIVY